MNEENEDVLPPSHLRGAPERGFHGRRNSVKGMRDEDIEMAIIGGTGIYEPGLLKYAKQVKVYTPYGQTSDKITVGTYAGIRIAFLPRHGTGHIYPPHKIPFRANMWALKQLGVKRIIAPCAVGSLREGLEPGHIVISDQFFDHTKQRHYSFYNGGETCHIAMGEPFCSELRALTIETAKEQGITFQDKGTIVTIEGPRFSTRAESEFFRNAVNADVIGMTLIPECLLARELEMCYVSIASVTDYDAWKVGDEVDAISVQQTMKKNIKILRDLFIQLLPKIPKERAKCVCPHALENAIY